MRSATTWWFGVVVSHPDIEPPFAKELLFFRFEPEGPEPAPDVAERYARYFPRPPGRITGEWSASYLQDPRQVLHLSAAAPRTRVLVILRDPLARLRSNVNRLHQIAPLRGEPPPSADVLRAELDRSLYAGQIEHLLALFERDRVLILQTERCAADPEGEAQRTWRFLGLDEAPVPPEPVGARPHARRYVHPLAPELEALARTLIPADARRLAAIAPEIDLDLWPSAAD